mmetsp:Transcript_14467/g.20110  ORF Transcript_14467/g.20110 Transcript_14467/m.20110 type:complete len:128 (-) Transcript_14467:223-606(-)
MHPRLVVAVRGEGLALLGRDRRVALDQGRHDTPGGFDTQRQRGDIQEKKSLRLLTLPAGEDVGLHRGTVRHSLVRVNTLVEFLSAKEVGDELLHFGNTSRTTDQNHVVHRALVDLRIRQDLFHRLEC